MIVLLTFWSEAIAFRDSRRKINPWERREIYNATISRLILKKLSN
jgi:hypothetical protein